MIDVKIDIEDLPTGLDHDFYDYIGQLVRDNCQKRMSDNKVKPATSQATLDARRGRGEGKTLVDNSILMQSIKYAVEGESVAIGTNLEYAATHQYGDTRTHKRVLKRKSKAGNIGDTVEWTYKVEGRPFLVITKETEEEIKAEIAEEFGAE